MANSFPPDVVVLDRDALVHARLSRGKRNPQLIGARSYRLAGDTFGSGAITPEVTNESGLAEALRRLRMESGRWDRVSLLLPDSWFRINIIDVPSIPARPAEAMEVVRWSLKRTLPVQPEELRLAYEVVSRSDKGAKVLTVSAQEKSLAAIERVFAAAGLEIVLIEPVGLNIWNAIIVRETSTPKDRILVYVRDTDFTTAVFRGGQPLFIRSRNLSGERSIEQEIRLSATYLRDTLGADAFEQCYVAGRADADLHRAVAEEFRGPVRAVNLREFVDGVPEGISGYDAELTACTGVFTA